MLASVPASILNLTRGPLGILTDSKNLSHALDDEPHDPEEGDVAYNETHGRGGQIGSDYEDDEPELDWTGDMDQERASRHLRLDAVQGSCHSETEHDGREPDVDREPECEDEAAEHDGREPPSEPFTSGGPLP